MSWLTTTLTRKPYPASFLAKVLSEIRLVSFVWDIERRQLSPEISTELLRVIAAATVPEFADMGIEKVEFCLTKLDEAAHHARLQVLRDLRLKNDYLLARKLASLDNYFRNRLYKVNQDIDRTSEERIKRMKHAERERIQADFSRKRADITDLKETDILSQRISAGTLLIERQ